MDNIHPVMREALAPFVSPTLRPFSVRLQVGAKPEDINVMAESSCDAIARAIDLFLEDGALPSDGLTVRARPLVATTEAAR